MSNPYHYEAHFSPEEFAQLLHIMLAYQHEHAVYSDMRLHAALSAVTVAKGAYEGGKTAEGTGPCALCKKPMHTSNTIVPWGEAKQARAHATCAEDRKRGLA